MPATRLFLMTGILLTVGLSAGCASARPVTIGVETSPPGAAITVESEFVGRSPTQITLSNPARQTSVVVTAEGEGHKPASRTIKRKSDGKWPAQIYLQLVPRPTAATGGLGAGGVTIIK